MFFKLGDRFDEDARIIDVRKGGMGVIYICEGCVGDFEGRFAVKTCADFEYDLRSSLKESFFHTEAAKLRKRFAEEAKRNLELELHPNIVSTYAVQQREGIPYIIMEYIDGPTIRDLITSGPIELNTALSYAIQVAYALQFAYDTKGLIHRDIKPENILTTPDGVAKIADFGLATALTQESLHQIAQEEASGSISLHTSVAQILGTLPYMSPEQVVAPGEPTLRSDIYSFGIVLYEMLEGKKPFFISDLEQMLKAITSKVPPPLSHTRQDAKRELGSVIAKCLSKIPEERFANYLEIVERLAAIASSLGFNIPASPQTNKASAPPWIMFVPVEHIFRKAMGLVNLGLCEEALKQLEAYNFEALQSPALFHAAGTACGNLNMHEKAIRLLDKALEVDSSFRKRALFNKGNSLMELKRIEEAVECYKESFNLDPRYTSAILGLAQAAYASGDYQQALHYCERAITNDLANPAIWTMMISSLLNSGQKALAEQTLQRALQNCLETPLAFYNFALIYNYMGDSKKATEALSRFLDTSDYLLSDLMVNNALIIISKTSDDDLSYALFKRLVQIAPNSPILDSLDLSFIARTRIDLLTNTGDFEGATQLIERVLKEHPEATELLVRKAHLLQKQAKFEEALKIYDVIFHTKPEYAEAHYHQGNVYLELQRFNDAVESFNRAVAGGARSSKLYVSRAYAFKGLKQLDLALENCESGLKIEPEDLEGLWLKGQIIKDAGRYEEAISWFDHVLSIHADNVSILQAIYHCLLSLDRFDEAIYYCTQALKLSPKDAGIWHNKGEALFRLGKYQDALECYMNAVTIKEDFYHAYTGIGTIHLLARDYTQAVAYFEKTLKYDRSYSPALNNLLIAKAKQYIQEAVNSHGMDEKELERQIEDKLKQDGYEISLSLDRIFVINEGDRKEIKPGVKFNHSQLREQAIRLTDKGHFSEAIMLLKQVVHNVPSDYESWHALGVCHDQLGQQVESLSCFDQSLRQARKVLPEDTIMIETLNSKGEALRKLGRFEEAITLFDEVLKYGLEHEFAWNNKGICLKNLERFDEARTCYRRALQANAKSWRALINLGTMEAVLDNEEVALECCRKLESMEEKNSLIHLGICSIYVNLSRTEDAKKELAKTQQLDPSNPNIPIVAEAIYRLEKQKKDEDYLPKSLGELNPKDDSNLIVSIIPKGWFKLINRLKQKKD